MSERKELIRKAMIRAIIRSSEEPIHTLKDLERAVVKNLPPQHQELKLRAAPAEPIPGSTLEIEKLSPDDWALFSAIYWDLVLAGEITAGLDPCNPGFEWFRVASEHRLECGCP